jgi:hypothetical protein
MSVSLPLCNPALIASLPDDHSSPAFKGMAFSGHANKRLAQLKKAYASSNIDDKEIPPFKISSNYLTHFQNARQKRKTDQTYKETQQKPLPTQLGTLKRDLEKLQETLKMQEDFIREQENQIKLLEQQDEENIKPLFNLEDFPYLNSYYKDFLAKNRFFSIKSQESLKEIKQKDRIRAEEKRKELIERLKKEIETKKILHQFLILEPLWFPTNHLFLNSALKKIYQLPNQQDDVDE